MRKYLVFIFFLSGCVYHYPAIVSSTSLGSREMPVGVVSGKSTAFYLFGLHVGGQDTLSSALEDALETVPRLVADTMVNVFVDRRVIYIPSNYFPIFTRIDTVLSGTLIKYQDKNFLEMKNLKNYETPEFQNNK